mmetsp:Transcript_11578/g.22113  ORF Transcript_11578/g.22113 Transcript_11578/m.22113 type:complete len:91 (-) Transcript_11578:729-1001(-)
MNTQNRGMKQTPDAVIKCTAMHLTEDCTKKTPLSQKKNTTHLQETSPSKEKSSKQARKSLLFQLIAKSVPLASRPLHLSAGPLHAVTRSH